MKISVIIPYHNEEKYITDCLASLSEQTCKDFEAVVVCDHCRPELLEKLQKQEVPFSMKIIELQAPAGSESCGVAAARNAGVANSEGEYLFFLDCDDYIEPETLEEMLKYAEGMDIVNTRRTRTWYGRKVYYDNGKQLYAQYKGKGDGGEDAEEEEEAETEVEQEEPEETKSEWERIFRDLLHNSGTITGISVLGILIRRSYWEGQGLVFDEKYRYYTDIPVTIGLFMHTAKVVEMRKKMYIKRRHNDPINLPALSQISDEKTRILEIIDIYRRLKETQDGTHPDAETALDRKYIKYYVVKIAPFYINANKKDKKEIYDLALPTLRLIKEEAKKKSGRYSRKLLKLSESKGPDEIAGKVSRHSSMQTLRRVIKSRSAMKKYLYRKVFSRMKMLEDTVILESFFGRNYSDSPKYIFEELNRMYPGKYKYVWVFAKGKKAELPYPSKTVVRFGFRYYYYMARCKYIVFNGRQPTNFIKRKGNVFLQTWHGTPLKKLVFDMDEVTTASPLYKKQFYIQTRSWDYLVAPNQFSEDVFRHAFMYDGKMLETGYPRNDILHMEDKSALTAEIKRELGLPQEKKVILYAPTWRDDEFYASAQYKFTLQLDLGKMQKELGDEYVILLRTHYFVVDSLDLSPYEGFAYNVSQYNDIARLYLISDLLITDYSSVFFDYANLKRPMLFFTYDLEKYRSVLRGFYIDVEEELPGPLLFDTEQVLEAVHNLPKVEEEYKEKYEKFYQKYCGWENGTACRRVIETVFAKGEKENA